MINRLFCLLLLCLLFSSCRNNQRQLANEKNILGDWSIVGFENKSYNLIAYPLSPIYSEGFTFYKDDTFANNGGYFNRHDWGKEVFLGTLSNFKITNDSLFLFNPENKTWDNFKIFKLTNDSLKLGVTGSINVYEHIKAKTIKTPAFDKIVLSNSDCSGPCPIFNIILNEDGKVIFEGVRHTSKDGLYEASISKQYYQHLQDAFRRMDFDSLKDQYVSSVSDGQTVTTTFVINGKIFKTVYDYRRIAPSLFRWAYLPLEHLYETIPLKKITYPDFMKNFEGAMTSKFSKRDSVLELKQSETFLLSDLMRNAKIVTQSFKPRFKFDTYLDIKSINEINTDGRYFTFTVNGKSITIDIGFNFYDVNAENWVWIKTDQ